MSADNSTAKLPGGMRPFSRSLPMQLMRAREAVMERFRPDLRRHGLTDQQWRVIRALMEDDSQEIGELGERCCIHPASLSRMLPKMAAAGLIARRPHDSDQRRVIVSLSARGQQLFGDIAAESERIYAVIAAEFGSAQLQQVYDLLDLFIDKIGANPEK